MDFRDWLASVRNDPKRRMSVRRNGRVQFKSDGKLIPGPFTLAARREILLKLREAENFTSRQLITEEEIRLIHKIWMDDAVRDLDGRLMALSAIPA